MECLFFVFHWVAHDWVLEGWFGRLLVEQNVFESQVLCTLSNSALVCLCFKFYDRLFVKGVVVIWNNDWIGYFLKLVDCWIRVDWLSGINFRNMCFGDIVEVIAKSTVPMIIFLFFWFHFAEFKHEIRRHELTFLMILLRLHLIPLS